MREIFCTIIQHCIVIRNPIPESNTPFKMKQEMGWHFYLTASKIIRAHFKVCKNDNLDLSQLMVGWQTSFLVICFRFLFSSFSSSSSSRADTNLLFLGLCTALAERSRAPTSDQWGRGIKRTAEQLGRGTRPRPTTAWSWGRSTCCCCCWC